ncbi:NUDIX hydrolase [Candidatus Bathyarchaeota archaeon]|nr:MAG: NUDIX hydrolase [Candidatus Bathyarchaeota archaeon]
MLNWARNTCSCARLSRKVLKLTRENLRFRKNAKPWKTIESKEIASLGDLKLHRDRIRSKTGFEMIHPRLLVDDFSIIVPVLGGDKLVMIWNYRHAIQGWELELPAGHIENGESPEACARRELEEETGYFASSWKRLGWFHPSPGLSSQRAFAFVARSLKRGVLHREPYEFGMEVRTLGLRDAYNRLWRGEIVHSPTASALGIAQPGILPAKKATVSRRS